MMRCKDSWNFRKDIRMHNYDTWYDQNGRIAFTNNRSMTGVGFTRKDFEVKKMKRMENLY